MEMKNTETAKRAIDTTRMIATFSSLGKKGIATRHYVAAGFRAVQACDGRSISAISVSETDERYKTCSKCAKLVAPLQTEHDPALCGQCAEEEYR